MFITITRSMLRRVAAAAAAFAVVAALFMMFPQGKTEQTAAADGNWGLSFRAEGQQPEGNVSAVTSICTWSSIRSGTSVPSSIS